MASETLHDSERRPFVEVKIGLYMCVETEPRDNCGSTEIAPLPLKIQTLLNGILSKFFELYGMLFI